MLVRLLSSICALVTAAAGVLLMDCEWNFLAIDSMGMCSTVESFGLAQTAYVGVGLGAFALLALLAIWIPGARQTKTGKGQIDREESFYRNIERISGPVGTLEPVALSDDVEQGPDSDLAAHQPLDQSPRPPEASIVDKLEALEVALAGGTAAPTREETEQWMRLLREVNDLHNRGELATAEFRTINTRLLDLVIEPGVFV